jgi:hypothetical protein
MSPVIALRGAVNVPSMSKINTSCSKPRVPVVRASLPRPAMACR